MTIDELKELLVDVWHRQVSADEAWDSIDCERDLPNEYSKEWWLPIKQGVDK